MIELSDLRFFLVLRDAQSLAAAARALGVTPPAVSQRLAGLEQRLGMTLVQRRRRQIVITDEGRAIIQSADTILGDLDRLQTDLAAAKGQMLGTLRIGAPHGFGRVYMAKIIEQFRRQYAQIDIELTLGDNPLDGDLANDLTLHIGNRPHSGGSLVWLAPNERVICASPAYVASRKMPEIPEDLGDHDCIVIRENNDDSTLWNFSGASGSRSVRIRPCLASNDAEVARDWARADLGVIVRSEWAVADDLRRGDLVRLLPGWSMSSADVIAVVQPRSARLARTQSFLNLLKSELRTPPWRAARTETSGYQ